MNTNTTTNLLNEITKIPNFTLTNIKDSHDDEYKQKIFKELLDINSLDRCYILYFIFKRKGDFNSLISSEYINNDLTTILKSTYTNNNDNDNDNNNDNDTKIDEEQEKENIIYEETDIETETESETEDTVEDKVEDTTEDTVEKKEEQEIKAEAPPKEEVSATTEATPKEEPDTTLSTPQEVITDKQQKLETYNSYELYKKIINKLNLDLDETSIPDIQIQIGDTNYELTVKQLNFIQWIYYIGLYDYLIDIKNSDIKYDILNEMNELSLLSGNLFLRYQLFLCDYEYEKNKK